MKSHTRKLIEVLWEKVNKVEDRIEAIELKSYRYADSNYVNSLYAGFLELKRKIEQLTCDHKEPKICNRCGKEL